MNRCQNLNCISEAHAGCIWCRWCINAEAEREHQAWRDRQGAAEPASAEAFIGPAEDPRQPSLPFGQPASSSPVSSEDVYLCLYCGLQVTSEAEYYGHSHPEHEDRQHLYPIITCFEVTYPDGRKRQYQSWDYPYTLEEYAKALGLIEGTRLWCMGFGKKASAGSFECLNRGTGVVPRDMLISTSELPDIEMSCLGCEAEMPLRKMTPHSDFPGTYLCASCANPQPKPKKKKTTTKKSAAEKKVTIPKPTPPTPEEIEAFKEQLKAFEKATTVEEAEEVEDRCDRLLAGCEIDDPRYSLLGDAWIQYGAPLAEERHKKEAQAPRKTEKKTVDVPNTPNTLCKDLSCGQLAVHGAEHCRKHQPKPQLHASIEAWAQEMDREGYGVKLTLRGAKRKLSYVEACAALEDQPCDHQELRSDNEDRWERTWLDTEGLVLVRGVATPRSAKEQAARAEQSAQAFSAGWVQEAPKTSPAEGFQCQLCGEEVGSFAGLQGHDCPKTRTVQSNGDLKPKTPKKRKTLKEHPAQEVL